MVLTVRIGGLLAAVLWAVGLPPPALAAGPAVPLDRAALAAAEDADGDGADLPDAESDAAPASRPGPADDHDPEDDLDRPPRSGSRPAASSPTTVPAGAVTQPDQARRLYWVGQYAAARQGYERLLIAAGPASQPASPDFAKADDPAKQRVAASVVGLAELDLVTGAYAAGLKRLAELDQGLAPAELAKLSPVLHRQRTEALVRLRLATGQYEQALADAQAAMELSGDLAFRYLVGLVQSELNRPADVLATLQPVYDRFTREPPKTVTDRYYGGQALYLRFRTKGNLSARLLNQVLQDYFQVAVEGNPRTGAVGDREFWPALLASGRMLLLHYQKDQAIADAVSALRINRNLGAAYVLLAQADLEDWNFERIDKRIARALAINPNDAEALVTLGQCRMLERKFDQAITLAERALAVNPRHPEALALRVAALMRQFKDADAARRLAEAEQAWPRDPRVYYLVAEALSGGRQFPEAEKFYRQAIAAAPAWADPLTGLGLMYMQTGDDAEARTVLEASHKIDSYNVRTFNTLTLLDYLQGRGPARDGKLVTRESPNFILRYDSVKDAVLGEYFLDYLERMYKDVTDSFDHRPAEKTIIEVYPSQARFAVRITGEPWIPTVGASTGRVIAMTAPRKDAGAAPYNWTSVLKHEFTHTVTLAATRNRIPHWFTEGLAVYAEDTQRPWDWATLLADAVRRDDLFTLDTIDWGFVRPRRQNSRQMAYAQSEWMCEFIVEKWGYDSLNRMLALYRDGRTQDEVIAKVCGLSATQFDRSFAAWARAQVASWGLRSEPVVPVPFALMDVVREPGSAAAWARLAAAYYDARQPSTAAAVSQIALALQPAEPTALRVAARAFMTLGHRAKSGSRREKELYEKAAQAAEKLAEVDPASEVAPRVLWTLAMQADDYDRAEPQLKRYQQRLPLDPASYRALAGLYLARQQPEKALPQLIRLSQADEHDARLPRRVAAIFAQQGDLQAAVDWQRRSIEIDPYDASTHYQLGQWLERLGDEKGALREYRVAAMLQLDEPDYRRAVERLEGEELKAPASQPAAE